MSCVQQNNTHAKLRSEVSILQDFLQVQQQDSINTSIIHNAIIFLDTEEKKNEPSMPYSSYHEKIYSEKIVSFRLDIDSSM